MYSLTSSRVLFAAVIAAIAPLAQTAHADTPSTDLNTYALFALDSISFKGGINNFGHINGNVGVNNVTPLYQTFSLDFGTSSNAIMADNTQVTADSINDGNSHGGSYYDLFANSFSNNFASTIRHNGPTPFVGPIIAPGLLPVLPFTPGRAITANASDLTLTTGTTTSLSPGNFRNVIIKDDSVITFSAGTYNMQDLQIGKNVTFILNDNTIFQIDQTFDPQDDDNIGTNAGYNAGAFFYVGGLKPDNSGFLNPSTTPTTNLSHDSEYHFHYFAPNSWIDLGGNGNTIVGSVYALRMSGDQNVNVDFVPPGSGGGVPEPATLSLLALAAPALLTRRRKA